MPAHLPCRFAVAKFKKKRNKKLDTNDSDRNNFANLTEKQNSPVY